MIRELMRAACTGLGTLLLACAQPEIAPVPLPAPLCYDSAVARVTRRQLADDSVVVSGGRSILMTHGARAARVIVLLHGFTDAPTQFEALGRRFFAAGDNVYVPRLPHHAERVAPVRALGRVRARELALFGDSVVGEARGLGDTIVVAGLSAGGAIAAYLAQTRREVRRAVLIAPAIAAGVISEDDDHVLVELAARLPEIRRTNRRDTTHAGPVQGITTHGLAEVLRLGKTVRQMAEDGPPGAGDIAFLLNERDHTVSEQASLELAKSWIDHDTRVVVYRFPKERNLPHNVMEVPERGGNPEVVLPVIESLVLAKAPPATVELLVESCAGPFCAIRRAAASLARGAGTVLH